MVHIPTTLFANIRDVHGERGRAWLAALPDLVSSLEDRWDLQVGPALESLTYHFVAPAAVGDGRDAILKLGVPGPQFENEIECLKHFAGQGAVQLFQHDAALAAMLLERVKPGTDIKRLSEEDAVRAAAGVMARLHQAPGASTNLPSIRQWGEGFRWLKERFDGQTGPLPGAVVEGAEALYFELAGSMDHKVVLHGDLHHENILSSSRGEWLAIDPQGVVGEPCYEVGAFLRNPVPDILTWPDLEEKTRKRVALFCDLMGFDRQRICGWGFSQAVLSAIWSLEDHGSGWERWIRIAGAIRAACA